MYFSTKLNTRWFGALFIAAQLSGSTAFAATEDHAQAWLQANLFGRFTPKLRYFAEAQPRFDLGRVEFERILLRTAIGYQLPAGFSVWLGYGWTPLVTPSLQHEHRLYEQLMWEGGHPLVAVQSRTRFEQRFIGGLSGVWLRARTMLRGVLQVADTPLRAIAWDEIFFNLNSPSPSHLAGFDQNRFFVGPGIQVGDHLLFELGYLHNYIWRPHLPTDRVNHVVFGAVTAKL
ncbi:MAG: DUF2490 domain-containing protein [Myxococcaceae bacterium]